jgi:ribokinase
MLSDGDHEELPAHVVDAVDTVGAGDAYCGALGARLAAGDGLDAAARWAGAAGSLAVTRAGAEPSLPTAAEIAALLDRE